MSNVLEGGEGVTSGGRAERSRESGVWVPFDMEVDIGLPDEEAGGEVFGAGIVGDVWGESMICEGLICCQLLRSSKATWTLTILTPRAH